MDLFDGHAVAVVGYQETSNAQWLYIHENWQQAPDNYDIDDLWLIEVNEGWDNGMLSIHPGGIPRDHYDYDSYNETWGADDDIQNASTIEPAPVGDTDQAFSSRQTHNLYQAGDVDWIKFDAVQGRKYTIRVFNRGTNFLLHTDILNDSGNTFVAGLSGNGEYYLTYDSHLTDTVYAKMYGSINDFGHDTNFDVEITYEDIVYPDIPSPGDPQGTISTLQPTFNWSKFQDGGDGATQAGYQIRVRSDSDNDRIVYDTGFIPDPQGNTHTYRPSGTYSGWDSTSQCERISEDLEWSKDYHWHIRYMDSDGDWGHGVPMKTPIRIRIFTLPLL